jgi:hypothetical protein
MKQSALDNQTAILFPKKKQIQISILVTCKIKTKTTTNFRMTKLI